MTGRWLVLSVRSPAVELETELAAGLFDLGATGVEEPAPGVLRAWLPEPADPQAFMIEAAANLSARIGRDVEVEWEWQEEHDWLAEWRRGLGARRVGERLVVTPTWIEPSRRVGDIVIALDPQMAFGTGEHATTRLVLRALEPRVRPGMRVLDVGTGSGILAIAAAALGATPVDAVESDAEALPNAGENVERNGVARAIRLRHGLVDEAWLGAHGPWDLILANVLSGVLRPLLPAFRDALVPGGRLIVSGILREEAPDFRESAAAARLELESELEEEEWWCAVYRRSS